MSKANIQTTTRELKEKSKALLERIKSFQEQVTASYKEIRATEISLGEKLKEEKRIQAESAVDRMTAYVMPDEPEAPKEETAAHTQPERPAARPAQAPSERQERPFQREPRMDRGDARPDNRMDRGPRPAPQRDARAPQRDGMRPQPGQQARPAQGTQGRPQRPDRPQGGAGRPPMKDGDAAPRPGRAASGRTGGAPIIPPVVAPATRERTERAPEPVKAKTYDNDRKGKSKKAAIKEAPPAILLDDERMGSRKRPKKQQQVRKVEYQKIEHAIIPTETVTVKELSEIISKPVAEIIKKLFMLGIMATINNEIDFDTCELIAAEYDITLEHKVAKTQEEVLQESVDVVDEADKLRPRPPVVTIMGHVDHGKTSLLDAIRNARVTASEAGGITQHIGAYTVEIHGQSITFLDTPGHEAFTSMRARGAQATDIAILVVAADDGIMPQTIEAINHAKAAEVPIIVAINKIDKPTANPDKVMQQLTERSLVPEEWGGDVICVPVSAKTGQNLDKLLEMILLVAEVEELTANPDRAAKGIIIEAKLDKGRGPVATVLVQNGTLKVGDTVVAGTAYGRVRAMLNDRGQRVETALPSMPVEVLGFNEVPNAGDILNAVESDKFSRSLAEERKDKIKAQQIQTMARVSLDDLFSQIAQGEIKTLNIIVKADVQGSVEAVKQSLEKLSNDEVRVRCIHGGVGAITESDVLLAAASNAIIVGFNVRPDAKARENAERDKVDIRLYRVIYNAIEDVEKAMKGMLAPQYKEVVLGRCEVRSVFKVSGVGTIAGCYVQEGKVTRAAQVRVVRDGIVITEDKISSLRRFKDDVKEVAAGYECGIGLASFNDIKEGDQFEAFIMEEIER
ncbi:MAG: translation initiation factor IF-2 [Christensenellales bacterium]|jgi:translation initiation factor IF-2